MTVTAATLAFVYWLLKCVAAVLACLYGIVKLIWFQDRRRQLTLPSRHEFASSIITNDHDYEAFLPRRLAPAFASQRMEKVARFSDVAGLIKTGDVLLFSGRTFWSYIIRIATFSSISHVGIAVVDDEGIWVVDSSEGVGVTKRLLLADVKKWPGQWYFAQIATGHRTAYSRKTVHGASQAMIGTKYGWLGIGVQAIVNAPVLREVAYFTNLRRLFPKLLPFCSGFVAKVMRIGGIDPVRARDIVLVTPQDIFQSAVITEPIALIP